MTGILNRLTDHQAVRFDKAALSCTDADSVTHSIGEMA